MMRQIGFLGLLVAGVAQAADYPAELHWSQSVALSVPVSGVVERVLVQPGQVVRQGEVLLTLNATVYQAAVMEARADHERLTEDEADAQRELARVTELYARTVSSTTELDTAKLRHARAKAQLAAAQARLERARRQLAETELRAPFDAMVIDRQAEPGLVVAAQCQPPGLLSLARSGEILARARLTPAQALSIRVGGLASVQAGDRALSGRIAALRFMPGDKPAYWVDVAIPRSAGLLAGQAATVRLP